MPKQLRLADQALLIAIASTASTLLSFASSAVLTRVWSLQDYGLYRQVLLVTTVLLPLVHFGLPSSVVYYMPRVDAGQRKALVLQTMGFLVLGGALLAALLALGSEWLAQAFGDAGLAPLLRVFSFYPLWASFSLAEKQLFTALGRATDLVVVLIIAPFLHPVAVALAALLGMSLASTLLLLSWLTMLRFLAVVFLCLRAVRGGRTEWNWALVKGQWRYSLPLLVSTVAGTLSSQLDRLLVSVLFSAQQYAVYSVGAMQVPLLSLVSSSVLTAIAPQLAREWCAGNCERFLSLWHSSIRRTALVFLPAMCFLFVFADPSIRLLFSDKYEASVVPFRIYLLLLPSQVTLFSNILETMGDTKTVSGVFMLDLLLSSIAGILAAQLLGPAGPAVALVLVTYLTKGLSLARIMRMSRATPSSILPWGEIARILSASAIAGVLAMPALALNAHPVLRLAGGGLLFSLAFVAGALLVKAVQPDDLALLKRWGQVALGGPLALLTRSRRRALP